VEPAGPLRPGRSAVLRTRLSGPAADLKGGLLLLDWAPDWRHDRGIGQGMVRPPEGGGCLAVEERLALEVPDGLASGRYLLRGQALDGQDHPLPLRADPLELVVETGGPAPAASPMEAPPNRIDQLRQLGRLLRAGELDLLFQQVGQINQSDPQQTYLAQGERLLRQRLSERGDDLEDLYGLALAQALQRRADAASLTLQRIVSLDPSNPHALMALGFVQLYRFHPHQAQGALDAAARLDPADPTLRTLRIVASALRLDVPGALKLLR
jgi:hypothetical protein